MGSAIIELGIGIIMVYMVLSLLVSQINNVIKNALNVRAEMYREEIERLLRDPVIRERVMNHPAVDFDNRAREDESVKDITPEALTVALIDVMAGTSEALDMMENLTNSPLVSQMVESVRNEALQENLQSVLATARNIADVKNKLTLWFDNGLNLARNHYARRMKLYSALVGAILVIILNVDTLAVGQALWNDPVLREATVSAANTALYEAYPGSAPENLEQSVAFARNTMTDLLDLRLPIGWYIENLDVPSSEGVPAGDEPDVVQEVSIVDRKRDTRNLWNLLPGNGQNWLGMVLAKLMGLTLTTLAVMQGAPFWFDLLKRITGR
jgi:hypothetical protein